VTLYLLNSFIHSKMSIAPLLLLRGAPDSSTVKNKSFKTMIECVRKCPRKEAQLKREAIPHRRAINTKSANLHESGTSKRGWEDLLPAERRERPLAIPDTDQLGKLEQCLTGTATPTLYSMRCWTGSQCKTSNMLPVTRPNFGIWPTRRAAESWIWSRQASRTYGKPE